MKYWGDNGAFHGRSLHTSFPTVLLRMLPSVGVYVFFFAAGLTPSQIIPAHPVLANEASTEPPAIVIGFVGGFIKHDNPVHSEVQLAARLRKEYPTSVDVETFESYRGKTSPPENSKTIGRKP